ncbi:hypothetical protein [Streptomyces sp. MB09-02B]|uniref:hypothetical protein n=1 Tax=Streptomyces sp. MB09-02B TaxID=3028667 RepID=UPI0029A3AE33|nr:hypothetical protein [Streptomyces sp. MB09-02B]MDX3644601.1 hypothetical protein [Streptomyces sp. MB09-02B]
MDGAAPAMPVRLLPSGIYYESDSVITGSLVMAPGVGLTLAWGLRACLLEEQQARDIAAVRLRQRQRQDLELANDLHDFVAHHVTGITDHPAPGTLQPLRIGDAGLDAPSAAGPARGRPPLGASGPARCGRNSPV